MAPVLALLRPSFSPWTGPCSLCYDDVVTRNFFFFLINIFTHVDLLFCHDGAPFFAQWYFGNMCAASDVFAHAFLFVCYFRVISFVNDYSFRYASYLLWPYALLCTIIFVSYFRVISFVNDYYFWSASYYLWPYALLCTIIFVSYFGVISFVNDYSLVCLLLSLTLCLILY